jgi:hypothetical protein
MAGKFSLKMPDFRVAFRDLLHAVNLRHGTHSFTSLPKEGVLRIFFALKNPTDLAGFEPANLGSKVEHAPKSVAVVSVITNVATVPVQLPLLSLLSTVTNTMDGKSLRAATSMIF